MVEGDSPPEYQPGSEIDPTSARKRARIDLTNERPVAMLAHIFTYDDRKRRQTGGL